MLGCEYVFIPLWVWILLILIGIAAFVILCMETWLMVKLVKQLKKMDRRKNV